MIYAHVTLAVMAWLAVLHIARYGLKLDKIRISPDGTQYLAMANGASVPAPYSLRWLLPWIAGRFGVGKQPYVWLAIAWSATIALGPLMAYYMPANAPYDERVLAVGLLMGLPGAVRINVMLPVLADGPALPFMLGSAAMCRRGMTAAGVLVATLGATVKESVPVFAALAAWSPWPLLGLVAVAIRWQQVRTRTALIVDTPDFSAAGEEAVKGKRGRLPGLNTHGHRLLQATEMLLPWGMCLIAVWQPSLQICAIAAAGYLQLIHGVDRIRLYQWAFPPIVARAAKLYGMRPKYIGIVLLVHLFHPWNDKCI